MSLGVAGGVLAGVAGAGLAADIYTNWRNYNLQRDVYNWQRDVQGTTWEREDTAVQRRVADLRAAGLSPVLAAGQGAQSGPVVSTSAPQIGKTGLTDNALMVMNMLKMDKDMQKTDADILSQWQQVKKSIDDMSVNAELRKKLGAETTKAYMEARRARTAAAFTQEELNWAKRNSAHPRPDTWGKFKGQFMDDLRNAEKEIDKMMNKLLK